VDSEISVQCDFINLAGLEDPEKQPKLRFPATFNLQYTMHLVFEHETMNEALEFYVA